MKICKGKYSCGDEKPVDDFYINAQGYTDNLCNKCRSDINNKRAIAQRKRRGLKKRGRKNQNESKTSDAINDLFKRQL